jgi:heat shock protein HslJ
MIKSWLFSMFMVLIVLSACGPDPGQLKELAGTRWKLIAIDGEALLADTYVLLEIDSQTVSGSAGCNRYGAEVTFSIKNQMQFKDISNAAEGCTTPAGVMEQEETYLYLLSQVMGYRYEQERLLLIDERGHERLYDKQIPLYQANPAELVEQVWHLKSVLPLGEVITGSFTIVFDPDNFAGTTTCRDYAGTYFTEGDQITITSIQMTTDALCNQVDALEESEFTTLLSNLEQFRTDPGQLNLYTRRGEVLIFEVIPDSGIP